MSYNVFSVRINIQIYKENYTKQLIRNKQIPLILLLVFPRLKHLNEQI